MLRAGAPQLLISRAPRSHSSDAAALPWNCAGSPTSTSRLCLPRCAGLRTTTSAAGGRERVRQNNDDWHLDSAAAAAPAKPPCTAGSLRDATCKSSAGTRDAAMSARDHFENHVCVCVGWEQISSELEPWSMQFCAACVGRRVRTGTHWDWWAEPVRCGALAESLKHLLWLARRTLAITYISA